jgi:formamidopyrimidine-DNA glycosylase
MSGDLEYLTSIKDEPTHSRILFILEKNHALSYISQRMFGRVDLTSRIDIFIGKKKLGPDAYYMNFEQFIDALKKRTAYAKSILMNQSVFAGIGNIYSDEILFKAGIHPKTKINKLDEAKLKVLFKLIKQVFEFGIKKKGDLSTYPSNCLIPHRKKNETCPRCGHEIERYEISGRHGFYCPHCQVQII